MENCIRIAVCDDLQTDREKIISLLSSYLDQNELYAKIDEFVSGEAFLDSDIQCYSLAFLDIFMDNLNGMETARKIIQMNHKIQIVFASTSIDFAAEAFDIEALHYIVKPIEQGQIYKVLDKFFESFYSMRIVEVKVGRLKESVYLSDILYIEAKGKKTLLHMKTGILEASQSLSEMAQILPDSDFCMPIRWALVSMREVTSMSSDRLKLSDQTEIPISHGKREEVKKAFSDFRWADMRRRIRGR
ncbi:LytR/AlgR family response regulator transcription factor [Blautia sp. MSJ-19]|uniref:LytR/AlgR family response regulator transcription factor n=1 Tax=Blautia sp. MSJ-19 TaxID=2841517 RepID=UPI001C0F22F4|nr:LytTR family DNA-binding domain-containing protein [Blautia sp. MSJ-19]MBU5480740.1 LytTR family DNA-binding domain-containing protein [Blautia sp. MSJ-19]